MYLSWKQDKDFFLLSPRVLDILYLPGEAAIRVLIASFSPLLDRILSDLAKEGHIMIEGEIVSLNATQQEVTDFNLLLCPPRNFVFILLCS